MSAIINAVIFAVTLALTVLTFYRKGTWSADHARKAFRFFTVQSNVFCGAAALLMCLFPGQGWSWTLKYVATAAVSVTMLTVFLFLGPTQGGYAALLRGSDFFMHLTTPLLAIVSFCVYERRGMGFGTALWGMLPVMLYGVWYCYKVVFAPEEKRWNDFYGFNRDGKWPIAFTAMLLGAFAVCMGLMAAQNL